MQVYVQADESLYYLQIHVQYPFFLWRTILFVILNLLCDLQSLHTMSMYLFDSWLLGFLSLSLPVTKIAEFANSVNLDEVAHNEPPHLDLHCLPSSL